MVRTSRGRRCGSLLALPLLALTLGGCSVLGPGIAREAPAPAAEPADTSHWAARGRPLPPLWREAAEPPAAPRSTDAAPAPDIVGLIGHALSLDGTRYRPGGNSPEAGFDCSGFVSYLYRRLGIELPRSSSDQFVALPRIERSSLQPGDLVYFRTAGSRRISHVGMFLGGDRFIHATSSSTRRVMVSSLSERYWTRTWAGARRVPTEAVAEVRGARSLRVASQP